MSDNSFIEFLPQDHPMIYYLLPGVIQRRCLALKRLSLEHEALDSRYKRKRRQICNKFKSQEQRLMIDDDDDSRVGNLIEWPFKTNPWLTIARKADELKSMALSQQARETFNEHLTLGLVSPNASRSRRIKQLLASCEAKCHDVLTQLANIDWEFFEYQETLTNYHGEIEDIMTQYNVELNSLYKRRLQIVRGEEEPSDEEIALPAYLGSAMPPNYLEIEQANQRLYSLKYSAGAERVLGKIIIGVPGFWLQALSISLRQLDVVQPADRNPLRYLIDVRYYYDTERESPDVQLTSDHRTQLLLFFFTENPYFSNRILSKTLYIDKSRKTGRETFDRFYVTKKEGCIINWFAGKDLTVPGGSGGSNGSGVYCNRHFWPHQLDSFRQQPHHNHQIHFQQHTQQVTLRAKSEQTLSGGYKSLLVERLEQELGLVVRVDEASQPISEDSAAILSSVISSSPSSSFSNNNNNNNNNDSSSNNDEDKNNNNGLALFRASPASSSRSLSFFEFFSPQGFPEDNTRPQVRRRNKYGLEVDVELDYEIFVRFRDFIVPHAVIPYSRGHLFGFESEHRKDASLAQKMNYLNTLFD